MKRLLSDSSRDARPLTLLSMAAVTQVLVLESPFAVAEFEEPGLSGVMHFLPLLGVLKVEVFIDEVPFAYSVKIGFAQDSRKTSPYFECPTCGRRCNILVAGSRLVCTRDYLTSGEGPSRRWRTGRLRAGRTALAAVARPQRTYWLPRDRWEQGERFRDRYKEAIAARDAVAPSPVLPKNGRATTRAADLSTARGLMLGTDQRHSPLFAAYLDRAWHLVDELDRSRPVQSLAATPAPITTAPVLDINVLQRERCWTDANGRIYVAQVVGSQISAIHPDTGEIEVISPMGGDIIGPDDLAFDPAGNLFVTELTEGRVSMLAPNGTATVIHGDMPGANGFPGYFRTLAACGPGEIVVATASGGISRYRPDRCECDLLVEGLDRPNGVAVSKDGAILVAEGGRGRLLSVSTGRIEELAVGLRNPKGVAIAIDGKCFMSEADGGRVVAICLRAIVHLCLTASLISIQ